MNYTSVGIGTIQRRNMTTATASELTYRAVDVTPPPRLPAKPGLYGIGYDVLTLGGLSLLALPAFWLLGAFSPLSMADGRIAAPLIALLGIASYAVNYPHYAATYARAYRSIGSIREYWWSCLVAPLLLAVLAGIALAVGGDGVPLYFKLYLLISGYHYSGQTYGIALIFAGKAKLGLNRTDKWLLMAPIYTSWLWILCSFENVAAAPMMFGETMAIHPLGLPEWAALASKIAFGLGIVAYAVLNVRLYRRNGKALPGVSHVVVAAQCVWFVLGANTPEFVNFVPFFHCLQYLMITTYFHLQGQKASASHVHEQPSDATGRVFLRYYGLLIVLGFLMYELTPMLMVNSGLTGFAEATALTIAFINLHHFIMDGQIWKLRKPEVKRTLIAM